VAGCPTWQRILDAIERLQAKAPADTRPIQPVTAGKIIAFPEVGGLHHRYERLAA
jgi:hypothetical protein